MSLEGPQCAGVGARAVGPRRDHHHPALGAEGRRSCAGDRQRLPARRAISATACSPATASRSAISIRWSALESKTLFKPNTRAVLVEAPGSQSFEMTDIPAIAEVAHARGALVIDDNTWATPLFHRSLDQGVDISMQAATKYIGGHSDIMFGTISANAKAWPLLAEGIRLLGVCAGPDDVFLALRGTAHAFGAARAALSLGPRNGALARHPPRSLCASCIRRLKATRATRSGSATSPARPACSALF